MATAPGAEVERVAKGSFRRGVVDNLPFLPGNLLWGAVFGLGSPWG